MKKNLMIFLVTVCLISACSVTLSGFRSNAKDDSARHACKFYKSIAVSDGDTLWSIAEENMDTEHYDSINDYIAEVRNMNTLSDDDIHSGKYLVIPYYDYEL